MKENTHEKLVKHLSKKKSGLHSMVDVYHEGNIMVCCLLTIMVVGGGLEGGLTGVTKKSAVREQAVDFCSG